MEEDRKDTDDDDDDDVDCCDGGDGGERRGTCETDNGDEGKDDLLFERVGPNVTEANDRCRSFFLKSSKD